MRDVVKDISHLLIALCLPTPTFRAHLIAACAQRCQRPNATQGRHNVRALIAHGWNKEDATVQDVAYPGGVHCDVGLLQNETMATKW